MDKSSVECHAHFIPMLHCGVCGSFVHHGGVELLDLRETSPEAFPGEGTALLYCMAMYERLIALEQVREMPQKQKGRVNCWHEKA